MGFLEKTLLLFIFIQISSHKLSFYNEIKQIFKLISFDSSLSVYLTFAIHFIHSFFLFLTKFFALIVFLLDFVSDFLKRKKNFYSLFNVLVYFIFYNFIFLTLVFVNHIDHSVWRWNEKLGEV